ncbi:hypothetical protein B0H19DRAFT_1245356 [Mycena capillaripes]|nr:hypothetical protein B0H19DRAFT_1245356 [Mycena capillaripes]
MRPSRVEGQNKSKAKGKARETKDNSTNFKVVSIHILACGTEFIDGVLSIPSPHDRTPARVDIQTAQKHGLAVLNDQGVTLDRNWIHDELSETLQDLLPHPFTYFHNLQLESGQPSWHLAAIGKNRRLDIVPSQYPTGAEADYNKGAGTSGWRNNRLWIVSREPIPYNVRKDWISPEALAFRVLSEDVPVDSADNSDDNVEECLPKPRRSKCRSTVNANEDEPDRKKRRSSASSTNDFNLPDIFTDAVARDIMGSDCIDLTAADDPPSRHSTPDILRAFRAAQTPRQNRMLLIPNFLTGSRLPMSPSTLESNGRRINMTYIFDFLDCDWPRLLVFLDYYCSRH